MMLGLSKSLKSLKTDKADFLVPTSIKECSRIRVLSLISFIITWRRSVSEAVACVCRLPGDRPTAVVGGGLKPPLSSVVPNTVIEPFWLSAINFRFLPSPNVLVARSQKQLQQLPNNLSVLDYEIGNNKDWGQPSPLFNSKLGRTFSRTHTHTVYMYVYVREGETTSIYEVSNLSNSWTLADTNCLSCNE